MKADIHVHTSESPCSSMSLAAAVAAALSHDIRIIAICNHDRVLKDTDLSDIEASLSVRINPPARCENEFYIIPGIEISTKYGHILGLFVDKNFEIDQNNPVESIKDAGGIAILAHPFERTNAFDKREQELSDIIKKIDMIEAASARANYKNKSANEQACKLSERHGVKTSAGSDAHFPEELGAAYMEIEDSFQGFSDLRNYILKPVSLYYKNTKRTFIAKSQLVKNKFKLKTVLFYAYCFVRDIGDKICRK